ncbi:MAG: M15 family metallopeptidase [Fimbriimonas sp.]|nr:M15 family metallopeptidase [Fimbriimonas sp.]
MPSKAEPVTELKRVKIVDNGEELVDFLQLCPDLRQDRPRFNYRRETLLRRTPAEMLRNANQALMRKGYRIQVIEGWRAPFIQRRMYAAVWQMMSKRHPEWSQTKLKRTVNQFTAPVDTVVPPPHTTGGAIDVAITDMDGNALDVLSPYVDHDTHGFFFDAPKLSVEARRHRDLLAEALLEQGLTNYPSEYWHWSYGDQGWAYRGGHPCAVYGAVTPDGWTPAPEDVTDEPLRFV